MPFRVDNVPLGKLERRNDGSLAGDIVVTRAGVFAYRGPSGETILEFRPAGEVFKADSLASARLIPITVEHPPGGKVTPENMQSLSVGTTGESIRQDGANVVAPVRITASKGIQAAERDKQQVSFGYDCKVERADGEHEGLRYTHKQSQIEYNHLALTVKARAGDVASFRLDADDAIMVDHAGGASPPTPAGRSGPMPGVQLRLDSGINYEVPAEVEAGFKARTTERDELKTRLDAVTAEKVKADASLVTMTAERDEAKANLEKAQKTDNAEAIRDGVKARIALVSSAHRAKLAKETLEKLDSMSDDEIRLAVIQSRHKDFDPKDRAPEYIAARFDAVVEGLGDEQDPGVIIAGDGTRIDTGPHSAREKSIEDQKRKSRGEKVSA